MTELAKLVTQIIEEWQDTLDAEARAQKGGYPSTYDPHAVAESALEDFAKLARAIAPARRAARVAKKRVYLAGVFHNYRVLLKDNSAEHVIWSIDVPTAGMGHAIVRAIRAYAETREGRFF